MAGTQTLVPTAANLSTWTRVGGSTDHGVLGDTVDDTRWQVPDQTGQKHSGTVAYQTALSLPARSRIRQVRVQMRGRRGSPQTLDPDEHTFIVDFVTALGTARIVESASSDRGAGAWRNVETVWVPQTAEDTDPSASVWGTSGSRRTARIEGSQSPQLVSYSGLAVTRAVLLVDFDEAPTLRDLTPTGTVTTALPPLGGVFLDDLGQQHSRREVIYAGTVGSGTTSSDLPAGTPVWDSGVVVGRGESMTPTTPLPNGTVTRYTQVVQTFEPQAGAPVSLWHRTTFTVNAAPPPAPVWQSQTAPTGPSQTITGTFRIGAAGTGESAPAGWDVEAYDPVSQTWLPIGTGTTPSTPQTVTVTQRVPVGVTAYRARTYTSGRGTVSAWVSTPSGWVWAPPPPAQLAIVAPWAGVAAVLPDGTQLTYAALSRSWRVADVSDLTGRRAVAVYELADRGLPIVQLAHPGGVDGDVAVAVVGSFDRAALEAVWRSAGPWLILHPHRPARWVAVVAYTDDPQSVGEDAWVVTLGTIQVDRPPLVALVTAAP